MRNLFTKEELRTIAMVIAATVALAVWAIKLLIGG